MKGNKSFASFSICFFHLGRPPRLRLALVAALKNARFGRIQCQRNEENSSSRRKRKRQLFLYRRTVRVEVKSKVIPTSFLKVEGRGTFVGKKQGRLVKLVGDQNPGSEAPPRSKREGSKGNVKRRATAREVLSGSLR